MSDRLDTLMQELYQEHRALMAEHLEAAKAGDLERMDAITEKSQAVNAMLDRMERFSKEHKQ